MNKERKREGSSRKKRVDVVVVDALKLKKGGRKQDEQVNYVTRGKKFLDV